MKVVVTGATGNVGTALLRRLLAEDDVEVVGLARRLPDVRRPDGSAPESAAPTRLQWASVDLTQDTGRPTLRWALREADAVVHLAWGFQPSHDPAYLEELGVGGTRRVLAAAALEGVPHVVHMSSVGAYSPKVDDRPVDESYPTDGIATSMYSRHKSAAERLLDAHERSAGAGLVTRLRPGIVGQRAAGSALLRYGLPGIVPGAALHLVPVLPLDRRLVIPMVHADDLADAVLRVLRRQAGGAFNLAAPPPLTPADIGEALGARPVHVPARALRAVVDTTWRAHVQPVDPGWFDLAMQVPLLQTTRATTELGWLPAHDATAVLDETVVGMRESAAGATPVLRPRAVPSALHDRFRFGAVSRRRRP